MKYNKYIIKVDDLTVPSVPIAAQIIGINKATLERKLQRSGFALDTIINKKHITIKIFTF